MKKIYLLLFFFSSVMSNTFSQAQSHYKLLAFKIDSMLAEDQKWRIEFLKLMKSEKTDYDSSTIITKMAETDSTNIVEARKIINKYGFPGYSLVGKQTSESFGGIILHADNDIPFQQKVLTLVTKEVERKNASPELFAYLTDRLLINKGKKQRYGTQTEMSGDGKEVIYLPVENPKNLNQLRKKIGLNTIEEYIKQLNKQFFGE